MTTIQKIFSLLVFTGALYGNVDTMSQFLDALSMYKQESTPENASILLAEFDKPENMGKNRPLMKQHLTRERISINTLRVQAKTLAAQEKPQEPVAGMESEELAIKNDSMQLKTALTRLKELEEKLSSKMQDLPSQEALIVDAALMININSIQGKPNDLHSLRKQIEKVIKIQEEIQQLNSAIAKKQQQVKDLETRLKQHAMILEKKRIDNALQQAQSFRDYLKQMTPVRKKS